MNAFEETLSESAGKRYRILWEGSSQEEAMTVELLLLSSVAIQKWYKH